MKKINAAMILLFSLMMNPIAEGSGVGDYSFTVDGSLSATTCQISAGGLSDLGFQFDQKKVMDGLKTHPTGYILKNNKEFEILYQNCPEKKPFTLRFSFTPLSRIGRNDLIAPDLNTGVVIGIVDKDHPGHYYQDGGTLQVTPAFPHGQFSLPVDAIAIAVPGGYHVGPSHSHFTVTLDIY